MSHKCAQNQSMSHKFFFFFEQKQLGAKLMASQQKTEERIKKWQDLRQAVASLKVRILENDLEEFAVHICYLISQVK